MTFRQPVVTNAVKRNVPVAVASQPANNLSVTTLLGQDALPCQSQNVFNPWGKADLVNNRNFVNGFNVNLEGVGAPPPPKENFDQPNPVLRKWSPINYGFTQNTSPELKALVFTIPQGQQSYNNPTLATVRRQDFNPPQPLAITTFVPPAVTYSPFHYFFADMGSMTA